MRNYDQEIEGLQAKIKALQLRKVKEEKRLEDLKSPKRKSARLNKHPGIYNREINPIRINNWYKTVTKGKLDVNQERVTRIKTWITFEGPDNINLVHVPKNVIRQYDGERKRWQDYHRRNQNIWSCHDGVDQKTHQPVQREIRCRRQIQQQEDMWVPQGGIIADSDKIHRYRYWQYQEHTKGLLQRSEVF